MQQLVKKYACWHSSAGCTLFRLATQLFAVALSDGLAPATSRSAVVRESRSRSTGAHTDTGEWPSVPTCEEMLSMSRGWPHVGVGQTSSSQRNFRTEGPIVVLVVCVGRVVSIFSCHARPTVRSTLVPAGLDHSELTAGELRDVSCGIAVCCSLLREAPSLSDTCRREMGDVWKTRSNFPFRGAKIQTYLHQMEAPRLVTFHTSPDFSAAWKPTSASKHFFSGFYYPSSCHLAVCTLTPHSAIPPHKHDKHIQLPRLLSRARVGRFVI